jgi:prepilin-type N-terminal cleavage/methylation domain-containing protein
MAQDRNETVRTAGRGLWSERGFTFIEIMVVVAILAILAALVVPRIMGRTDDAKRTAASSTSSTMVSILLQNRD